MKRTDTESPTVSYCLTAKVWLIFTAQVDLGFMSACSEESVWMPSCVYVLDDQSDSNVIDSLHTASSPLFRCATKEQK